MIQDNQLNLYGEMQSEKLAADNKVSHQIVSEINQFGVNDRQRWLIIYQLALEFENGLKEGAPESKATDAKATEATDKTDS